MNMCTCSRCGKPFWSDSTGPGWGSIEYCSQTCKRRAHHARRSAKRRAEHRAVCPTPSAFLFGNEKNATKFAERHQETAFFCPAGGAWHVTEPAWRTVIRRETWKLAADELRKIANDAVDGDDDYAPLGYIGGHIEKPLLHAAATHLEKLGEVLK